MMFSMGVPTKRSSARRKRRISIPDGLSSRSLDRLPVDMGVLMRKSSNFPRDLNHSRVSIAYLMLQGNKRLLMSLPVCLVSVNPNRDTPHPRRSLCSSMNSFHLNVSLKRFLPSVSTYLYLSPLLVVG
ncbi:hypothetical protein FR483_n701L [Paramecium bursaria Chlorella virus FR483]|uniref:Uncharacterized protein n701L n=1 Tax=Paramecium bursaria Chlorella virus FR483 TaxID=399781 RepID=A7J855_PBCVF|nr:hypothetical protein FR483_n701L [Paramecium bursaria Chlorella virus FR483]ABT15986.1 hypothetical protein FR483_n701L [Paramecium bursaria Chlorella virus FR483]